MPISFFVVIVVCMYILFVMVTQPVWTSLQRALNSIDLSLGSFFWNSVCLEAIIIIVIDINYILHAIHYI